MNHRRDLNLVVLSERQATGIEVFFRRLFVLVSFSYNGVAIVRKLIELHMVNEVSSLVYQNVGILGLESAVVRQDLLHGWIVLVL